ncbi:MAG: MBL fold metallo-hydrolase [Saprospiraceae bacterium]|nr:MBL fold metallo-hydrolase [Saprospiraceae bacterium]
MIQILDLQFLGKANTIAAFLVETSDGPILLETGPYSTYEHLKKELALRAYQLADIQHVFPTHIHFDHAGAAWALAKKGATVYVHPFGHKHLHNPEKLWNSAKMIYQDKMEYLWGATEGIPEEKLRIVSHGEVYNIGNMEIIGWHTPGHAIHHIAWQIGDALICGDVAGVRISNGIVVPPCPPPDIQIEDWQESLQLIRKLNIKTLYLTHYGAFQDVQKHLDALEQRLLDRAAWMKPHFEKGTDIRDITPLFQKYVKEEMISNGITNQEILQQYENANPSWMSVAGLLRYWQKKEKLGSG